MNRVYIRECLGDKFERQGWAVGLWNIGFVAIKNIRINKDDIVCLYFGENGYCGLLSECDTLDLSEVDVEKFQEVYDKYDLDEDLYLRLLKWDFVTKEIHILSSYYEEEFDVKTKEYVISKFRDFIKCIKGS